LGPASAEATSRTESLRDQADSTHQEARMVLPGIQALFGFQLIAVFNRPFYDLAPSDRLLHLVALVLIAISAGLIMAPASYRRLAEPTRITRHWIGLAARAITWAMAALMVGIGIDVYLVTVLIVGRTPIAGAAGIAVGALLACLWFALPWLHAARERREERQLHA
jgi:hypothetical protein